MSFMALAGLFLGVKIPTLTWTNEIMPIKQGVPVVIALFGGFGYIMLLFVGFMLLPFLFYFQGEFREYAKRGKCSMFS